jgi:hypothetical protein
LFDRMRSSRPVAANVPANAPAKAPPSLPLDRYAGTYVDSAYGVIEVTSANGALRAQIVNEPAEALEPTSYDSFRTRPADPKRAAALLTFVPDGSGGISSVRLSGVTFMRQLPSRRP